MKVFKVENNRAFSIAKFVIAENFGEAEKIFNDWVGKQKSKTFDSSIESITCLSNGHEVLMNGQVVEIFPSP